MKKVLGVVLATVVALGINGSFAGEACCPSKAKAAASACQDKFGKLNLTDAQKTKLSALDGRVKNATSTSEGKAMYQKGLEEILTADQLAQLKASCEKDAAGCAKEKASAGGCPFSGKAEKKN